MKFTQIPLQMLICTPILFSPFGATLCDPQKTVIVKNEATPAPQENRMVQVFTLLGLVQNEQDNSPYHGGFFKTEAVISAIETALAMKEWKEQEKPLIKFHSDSGLLFVYGTLEQRAIVNNSINYLWDGLGKLKSTGLQK